MLNPVVVWYNLIMHRIRRILATPVNLPLREVFETAARRATTSPTVIIRLIADGVTGYGEATPVAYVTGEDVQSVLRDVVIADEALRDTPLSEYRLSADKLAEALPHGKSARAGVEIAFFDALSRSYGVPLYSFLGGAPIEIETDVTIPIMSTEQARKRAAKLGALGFRIFKVKVGKDPDEDIARVLAIADGAPSCSFVLDANQGFAPDRAVSFIADLHRRDIDIRALEQPVDAADLDGLRYVTQQAGVRVIADEAAQTPSQALEIASARAAHGVNVKLMKCGITGALEIISICRAAGLELMFGCMLESRIGQSASAHIACGTHAFTIFDLDSDLLIANQPVTGGAERVGPVLRVSDRPGLGCEIVESDLQSFLEAY